MPRHLSHRLLHIFPHSQISLRQVFLLLHLSVVAIEASYATPTCLSPRSNNHISSKIQMNSQQETRRRRKHTGEYLQWEMCFAADGTKKTPSSALALNQPQHSLPFANSASAVHLNECQDKPGRADLKCTSTQRARCPSGAS